MNGRKNVLVTGSFDLFHSGHITFLKEANRFGDVFVGIGSDRSITQLKNRQPIYPEYERIYMVLAIRYVMGAWINRGMGVMDFSEGFVQDGPLHIDFLIVNRDQDFPEKREFCSKNGIEYVVLERRVEVPLPQRSSTELRKEIYESYQKL